MTIFPAVFLENLPNCLCYNAKKTASILLGQDREAILFWRLHSSLPKFLVVFRRKEDRDAFYKRKALQEVGEEG